MPLTWSEIRTNAQAFAHAWAGVTSERAEAQTFWNEFFAVFGVQRRRVAVYEKTVSRLKHTGLGRIDVFWPGLMLAEHKSAGADLDAAFQQAADYFEGLMIGNNKVCRTRIKSVGTLHVSYRRLSFRIVKLAKV